MNVTPGIEYLGENRNKSVTGISNLIRIVH